MDMEIEMSVDDATGLSTDEDNEPTPVEPAESDMNTTVASAPTPSSATAPADPRLHAHATDAAASVGDKEKGWEMLGLSTTAAS